MGKESMDLLKINLFRGGIFKQLKFLISVPQSAQKCVFIAESGIVSLEILPLHTGFVCPEKVKKAWAVLHTLKFQVRKQNELEQDESVLVISERSYVPLDPFNTIKEKDKARMTSLTDIAKLRHAEARAEAGKQTTPGTRLTELIINSCFVMLGIFALVTLIKGC